MSTTYTRAQVVIAVEEGLELAADESGRSVTERRFALALSAVLARLDNPAATWDDALVRYAELRAAEDTAGAAAEDGTTFTRDEVNTRVWDGIELAADNFGQHGTDDIDNLALNAVMTLLDDPAASFDDIAEDCYAEDPDAIVGWLRDATATERLLIQLGL
ncbi:hypothetical protein ACGFYQ_33835 [Streptomyces sp. NPDC048258]|uniref:hypothetical protein n=1 Tax=Streptomyces sp. NPDC048258 TaxID=3365527 RepID=UPI003722608C